MEVRVKAPRRSRFQPALRVASAALASVLAAGCSIPISEPRLHDPAHPPSTPPKEKSEPLKVHLANGELLLVRDWRVTDGHRLRGMGERFDARRAMVEGSRPVDVALADVALLETTASDNQTSVALGVFGTVAFVASTVTLYCTASPKSCFGSCPTFYVEGPGGAEPERPHAEGFSESIARVLEARDVDALLVSRPAGADVTVTMRNEALETHSVRRVELLAARAPAGGRVLAAGDGRLYPATGMVAPLACRAAGGDCLTAVRASGGGDRASAADERDLATRETLELDLPATAPGPSGVAIGARQTLLSTFLFYQTMAFTGRRAGEFLASVERGGPAAGRRALGMARVLGGIDVSLAEGDGAWRPVGSFDEAGPIAGDVRVVPFEATGRGPLRVRLTLARGHWRLDWVALARLGAPVEPVRLAPASVERRGRADAAARERLASGEGHLVTQPGDAYRLRFRLPEGDGRYELFLASEGYYYEWMREEWLSEEDPQMALLAVADPAAALRRLAPAYKAQEGRLEQQFWASRFRK
jgi:hypothetical protein